MSLDCYVDAGSALAGTRPPTVADIHKRQTNKSVRWDVRYRDDANRQRNRSFARRVDAQHFVNTVETDLLRGDWIDPRRGLELFGELAGKWLTTIGDKKPKTGESFESIVTRHFLPRFATVRWVRSTIRWCSVSSRTFKGANLVVEQSGIFAMCCGWWCDSLCARVLSARTP
ncbi:MAG: hypothetical protein ABI862_07120 [Ilumatobacteraceae bacterium]